MSGEAITEQSPAQPTPKILFRVQCQLGKSIRTTRTYWDRITKVKHPKLKGKTAQAKQALQSPDLIRQSKTDKEVYLYYKKQNKHYLCVVIKHLNGEGFIITSYFTSKILEGKQIWIKKSKA